MLLRLSRGALALRRVAASIRAFSSASPNPLLDVAKRVGVVPNSVVRTGDGQRVSNQSAALQAVAHYKNLPVSSKKLRVVANLGAGMYWKESMAQLEHCRKAMAVMVKNCIENAVKNAESQGLDTNRLIVDEIICNKGKYFKKADRKARGIKKVYFSHLRVIVKEVSSKDVMETQGFGRWKKDSTIAKLLDMPWAERIKLLPRYKPIPGYDPHR